MIIKSINIKNFRCFENYSVSFAPSVSIIIGRNGAGKSTLLDAIKMAISFIFASNKSFGKDFLSAGNPSLNISSFADSDYKYDVQSGTTSIDASICTNAIYNNQELNWELYKRSTANAALYSTKYKEAFQTFMNEWKTKQADLPLIACFSDSFPHKATKQTQFALKSIQKERIPRNFGYYQWNLDTACTSIWETRLSNQLSTIAPLYTKLSKAESTLRSMEEETSISELNTDERYLSLKNSMEQIHTLFDTPHAEIEYVQSRLIHFSQKLPKLSEEMYDIDYISTTVTDYGLELCLIFKNGKHSTYRNLPAGYRRLYSIVLDMAYRAYILNGNKEPTGIVLIDEIDLHLHPSLEQEVVTCLHEIFPKIQFVITSHSAAVLSNLNTTELFSSQGTGDIRANEILYMQPDQEKAEILPNIFGLDYNTILQDWMGTPSENKDINILIELYNAYKANGMNKEAALVKEKITDLLHDDKSSEILKKLQ